MKRVGGSIFNGGDMNLNLHPIDVVLALLDRSICSVEVSAILVDKMGIMATGWNSSGLDGLGMHAEVHCLRRCNRKRAKDAVLYVAARRRRNKKTVTAKPCDDCQKFIKKFGCSTVYRDSEGKWRGL